MSRHVTEHAYGRRLLRSCKGTVSQYAEDDFARNLGLATEPLWLAQLESLRTVSADHVFLRSDSERLP